MSLSEAPHVTIIDRPCGTGKTNRMLKSLSKSKRYLVIVPFLDEVDRVKRDACVPFVSPETGETYETKREAMIELLAQGKNIVSTHALFEDLGPLASFGMLASYDIIIDEVPDVVSQVKGPKRVSWQDIYIGAGYASVDAGTGRVSPTSKWEASPDAVDDTLFKRLFNLAKSGCLYIVDSTFFLWTLPPDLLTSGNSVTILTYMAEGSTLVAYLKKLGIDFEHNYDKSIDRAFRIKARGLLTLLGIPALSKLEFSFSAQTSTKNSKYHKRVGKALANLKQRVLKDTPAKSIILTCAKANWFVDADEKKKKPSGFSKSSRMFVDVNWLSNTTRGTNDYRHCKTAIYLWDQHPAPQIVRWLEIENKRLFSHRYARTELVQWLWRTAIRDGKPVTAFIPSERMRTLLTSWLDGEDLGCDRIAA